MPTALDRAGANRVAELAEMSGVRECLQWFTREKQWINEQHLRVVRIPAPTFFEQERAAYVAERFRQLDCEVQQDGAGNVIALPRKASGKGEFVVVSAHLDTVLAPRTPEEIIVDSGGGLRGPGVSDNGAGLAGLLALAGAIQASPPLPNLQRGALLLANVCEEGEGNLNGMRHFCEDSPLGSKSTAFLVLDGPAIDHITCTALESRRYEVSFFGPGGHSWSDFGMANPVHALGRAIAYFLEQQAGFAAAGGGCSYNFGWIEGGTGVNSIPVLARAKVDLRSENRDRMEALCRLLTAAVERGAAAENEVAVAGRVSARVRPIGVRPGGRLPDDAAILRSLKAVDAYLGIRAKPDCASTDANIPISKGLQAVSLGAGGAGGGAHTPSEWYHPRGRDLGLKRVFLTLYLLLREVHMATGRSE